MYLEKPLKLRNGPIGVYRLGADGFGAVHGCAAAEGHKPIAALFTVDTVSRFHIVTSGIGLDVAEHGIGDALFFHGLQHSVGKTQLHQTVVGDYQHMVDALFPNPAGEPFDAAGAFDILWHTVGQKVVAHFHDRLICPAENLTHRTSLPFR